MAHEDLAAGGRDNRCWRVGFSHQHEDIPFFIREQGKGYPEAGLESIHFFLAINNTYPDQLNILGQSGISLYHVVEPVNYRRVLVADRSKGVEELNDDKFCPDV
jgi:hypothetical protein